MSGCFPLIYLERIFPYFIVNGLPQGLTGWLLASVFAAGMSTISTSLNGTATVIYADYYKHYFQKDAFRPHPFPQTADI